MTESNVISNMSALGPDGGSLNGTLMLYDLLTQKKNLIKTESSSTISEIHQGEGFKSVELKYCHDCDTVPRQNVLPMINLYIEEIKADTDALINPRILEMIKRRFELLATHGSTRPSEKHNTYMNFTDGNGVIWAYSISLTDLDGTNICLEMFQAKINATIANPYVIITESESETFGPFSSSSSSQRIEYLPPTLRPYHIDALVFMNSKMFDFTSRKYLNPPTEVPHLIAPQDH
jgi:hypothetical protein